MSTVFAVFAVLAVVYFFEPIFDPQNEHPKPQKPLAAPECCVALSGRGFNSTLA
jgi:hypothetical protein